MTFSRSALRRIETLDELVDLIEVSSPLYVRFSEEPTAFRRRGSIDAESGLELPGLSVNPLRAEPWWTRPMEDWLARQLCQYEHLMRSDPDRSPWVLAGTVVGRGPDCEPLLDQAEAVALITRSTVEEARERYRARFDAGRGPVD